MNSPAITRDLERLFAKTRIVFWNDPESDFTDRFLDFSPRDITAIDLADVSGLEIKVRLELDDPEGNYLLYQAGETPALAHDWLQDIRLYSGSFRADFASLILRELGLKLQDLRECINRHHKFFKSKERLDRLKPFLLGNEDEANLILKMLAVLTRAEQPTLSAIVLALAMTDPEAEPPAWAQIKKFGLEEQLWALVRNEFGYDEEHPSLKILVIRMLVSDYSTHLDASLPNALSEHLLKGAQNAVVFLAQWRDSQSRNDQYDKWAEWAESKLRMAEHIGALEIEEILDVMTFPAVERHIERQLLERIAGAISLDAVHTIVARRKSGHWVSGPSQQREAHRAVYDAADYAATLLHLRHAHVRGFVYKDAEAMYKAYLTDLYRFDQLYRHFCENADVAAAQGWDLLKDLREKIEDCYTNFYLIQLEIAWGGIVEQELLATWAIEGVHDQYLFYTNHVDPEVGKRRAFVIISDALRYEVADELMHRLNGGLRVRAELSSQLGVLPSYTALGMASLLPHDELRYTKEGKVLVDGKPTSSLQQRSDVLSVKSGVALKTNHFMAMSREDGRAFVSDKRLVYLYHNEIDAIGDRAVTEGDTFRATRKAIQDMEALVRKIVNSFDGRYVVITSDHGFLFTQSHPGKPGKSALEDKPAGTVVAKKRYLLGRNLPRHANAWRGDTSVTAKAKGEMQFLVPKGYNLFHFAGGARFMHGGAMPQEIVVPVLKIKPKKTIKPSRSVGIQVLFDRRIKITAPRYRFNIVQMERVSDRVKPLVTKVCVYEGAEPVTDIATVTFDSASDDPRDRLQSVTLLLKDKVFDKRIPYRLVVRDAELNIVVSEVPVVIDRAIYDDF